MNYIKKLLKKVYKSYFKSDPVKELIDMGLVVGANFNMMKDVIIDWSHCWHITIGDDVTLAPRVYILAHDASTKKHLGYTRIGKVKIGNRVFIGASSVILPGVEIGDDVIIGAGSVVTKDVESDSVVAGNPAQKVCSTKELLNRRRKEMEVYPCFTEEYTFDMGISDKMKKEMNENIKKRIGYVI